MVVGVLTVSSSLWKGSDMKVRVAVVTAAALVLAVGNLSASATVTAAIKKRPPNEVADCHRFVQEKLISPNSARWIENHFVSVTVNGKVVRIYLAGTVDSTNTYGALVRADWTCRTDFHSDDNLWYFFTNFRYRG